MPVFFISSCMETFLSRVSYHLLEKFLVVFFIFVRFALIKILYLKMSLLYPIFKGISLLDSILATFLKVLTF